jgi:transmembrane sensor
LTALGESPTAPYRAGQRPTATCRTTHKSGDQAIGYLAPPVFIRCMPDGTPHSGPNSMSQPVDWEALARYIAGESSPDEVKRLEAQLSAHPSDKALIDALAAVTQRMAPAPADLDVEAALRQVKARRNEPIVRPLRIEKSSTEVRQPRWRVPFPAIAAAALLAIGVAGYLTLHSRESAPVAVAAARMVATGVGALDSLRLPDGSRAVLGPLSSITIASGYGATRRDVDVRGDVYLDVVHDPSKPFTAHAPGATIQDIGTRFTVRTDAPDGVAVSVSQGSVSLQGANRPTGGVVLHPGEKGVVLPSGNTEKRRGVPEDMAWLRGQLVFREAPISEVIASLHRWYGINLRVADPALASRHLTATFSGEPADRVLDVIRLALGAQIERRGDTAIVRATNGGERLK